MSAHQELNNQGEPPQLGERFIQLLRQAGIATDYRRIEEMLWLSRLLPDIASPISDEESLPPPDTSSTPAPVVAAPPPAAGTALPPATKPRSTPARKHATEEQVYLNRSADGEGLPASRVRVPSPAALPDSLELMRALRPFRRRVLSRQRRELDEEETVIRTAELGILTPAYLPVKERWFDVTLVVEEKPSMAIWRQAMQEFQRVLERLSAFREVRVLRLALTDEKPRLLTPAGQSQPLNTLADPYGRRLIFLVTDGVSASWQNGQMAQALTAWGRTMPVVIVQMLSERMWHLTPLGKPEANVNAPMPGAANRNLEMTRLWETESTDRALPFPLVVLHPASLGRWANSVVAGATDTPAVILSELPDELGDETAESLQDLSAAELVARFQYLASPTAFQLAVYLSAVPLQIPIMRLVQRVMLPESRLEHLSEFLLGGLVERQDGELVAASSIEEVVFRFREDNQGQNVKDLLQREIRKGETQRLYRNVAEYIEARYGQAFDFFALVADQHGALRVPAEALPFTEAAEPLLRRFGIRPRDPRRFNLPAPSDELTGIDHVWQQLDQSFAEGKRAFYLTGEAVSSNPEFAINWAQQVKRHFPTAHYFLDLGGGTDNPLSTEAVLISILQAFLPKAALPSTTTALRALYLKLMSNERALLVLCDASVQVQLELLLPTAQCLLLVTGRAMRTASGYGTISVDLSPVSEATTQTAQTAKTAQPDGSELPDEWFANLATLSDQELLVGHGLAQRRLVRQVWHIIELQQKIQALAVDAGPEWEAGNRELVLATQERIRLGQQAEQIFAAIQRRQLTPPALLETLLMQTILSDSERLGKWRETATNLLGQLLQAQDTGQVPAAAQVLIQLGELFVAFGDQQTALRYFDFVRQMAASASLLSPQQECSRAVSAAEAHAALGQYEQAEQELTRAQQIARAAEDPARLLQATMARGAVRMTREMLSESREDYLAASSLAQQSSDYHSFAICLLQLGILALRQAQPNQAIASLQEAQALFARLGSVKSEAQALTQLSRAYLAMQDPKEAVVFGDSAIRVFLSLDDQESATALEAELAKVRSSPSLSAAKIFLNFASEDRFPVYDLYRKLAAAGHKPLLDLKDIRGGEEWNLVMQEAIQEPKIFLACLSQRSISDDVFRQWAMEQALDLSDETLPKDNSLILVLFEEVELPERLAEFQAVRLFEPDGWTMLLQAIESCQGTPFHVEQNAEAGWKAELVEMRDVASSVLAESFFSFETVTLDARGEVKERRTLQARQFIEELAPDVTLAMVEIPGGQFTMGAPETEQDSFDRERPQHEVQVSPFFMGKFAVTQAQWRIVAGWEKSHPTAPDLKSDPARFKGDDRPVEQVSWEGAQEFCARLSQKTGRLYRLPTEAEWEYACRAGTTTPFAFGETIAPEFVNYDGERSYGNAPKGRARNETIPVGSLGIANAFGLYDMHGNVLEWCQDWYSSEYYAECKKKGVVLDPTGPANGDSRVLRGGSWNDLGGLCRSAYRDFNKPDLRLSIIGFRVVVSARTPAPLAL